MVGPQPSLRNLRGAKVHSRELVVVILFHVLVSDIKALEQLTSGLPGVEFFVSTTEMIGHPVIGICQGKKGNTAEVLAIGLIILIILAVLLGDKILPIMASRFHFPATPFCRYHRQ